MRSHAVAKTLAVAAGFSSLAAAADPKVVSIDFAKTTSSTTSLRHSKRDLVRRAGTQDSPIISNGPGALYYLNMTIGTPGEQLAVIVDSGSSDLWLPATGKGTAFCDSTEYGCGDLGEFDPSKSSTFQQFKSMGEFEIEYGDGTQIEGQYFGDNVQIGDTKLKNVTMAVALAGDTQYPINGIMGVGYILNESPSEEERESKKLSPYPNIISQVKDQGVINTLAYSMYMNDKSAGKGTILFGGVDKAKYDGKLGVVPVQPNPAYQQYYSQGDGGSSSGGSSGSSSDQDSPYGNGPYAATPSSDGNLNPVYNAFYVSLTSVGFSNSSGHTAYDMGMTSAPVLLDSGTSIMYLPDKLALAIYKQFGATISRSYGPLVPCSVPRDDVLSFTFGSGGPVVNVTMDQVVFDIDPSDLEGEPAPKFNDGTPACLFGITGAGDSSSQSSGVASFVLGDTFLSSAYVVFDMTNNQIGLAQGKPNVTSSSIVAISSTIPGDSTVTGASFSVASTPISAAILSATTRRASVTGTATEFGVLQSIMGTAQSGTVTGAANDAAQTGSAAAGGSSSAARSAASSTNSVATFTNAAAAVHALQSVRLNGLLAASVAIVAGLMSGGALLSWM